MPKVVISIVAWNSMRYLPECLASIANQTFKDYALIIIDNASDDGPAKFVRENHPETILIRNAKNLGFSRAHNQGFAYAKAHFAKNNEDLFIMVTNPDIALEPDYLEKIVDAVERFPEVGSAEGKLLRMFHAGENAPPGGERSNVIDTTGMRFFRSRRMADRGAGEKDSPEKYNQREEVFGVSGSLALYRLRALEDVAVEGEYFDEDFFTYKEDIDMAWRLRNRGWASWYVPAARAYHYRTAAGREKASNWQLIWNRRKKPAMINFWSDRNHSLMTVKNDFMVNALLHFPWILWYHIREAAWVLVFEQRTVKAWFSFWKLLPRMLRKRRLIMSRTRVKAKEIRRWMK